MTHTILALSLMVVSMVVIVACTRLICAARVDYATELSRCIHAWQFHPDAPMAWCLHHEVQYESVHPIGLPGALERIRFMLANKNASELRVRFKNFRPIITGNIDFANLSRYEITVIHKAEWPDTTWCVSCDSIFCTGDHD